MAPPRFEPLSPFDSKKLLAEIERELARFRYKLYGSIPLRFHRGKPTAYEFDLNLGVMHFTEQDFQKLSKVFARLNKKWGTRMTFCIYPSKVKKRDMILNVRGSSRAALEPN